MAISTFLQICIYCLERTLNYNVFIVCDSIVYIKFAINIQTGALSKNMVH